MSGGREERAGAGFAVESGGAPSRRGAALVFAVALAVRLAVVAWAAERIPPAADGAFYHTIASRIARGLGYTWLWPDGAVTNAGHYPIGYPALAGAAYAIAGPHPAAAMLLNALLGALAAPAAYVLAGRALSSGGRAAATDPRSSSARAALAAGLLAALHPGLVAYTPALMTEGVTASLVACAAWAASEGAARSSRAGSTAASAALRWAIVTGVITGVATLVRPQSLVLAPILGWLAAAGVGAIARSPFPSPGARGVGEEAARGVGEEAARGVGEEAARGGGEEAARGGGEEAARGPDARGGARGGATGGARWWLARGGCAAAALVAALAVCAPWTARNCVQMKRCALVSHNGGWNLLIGTNERGNGGWTEVVVPPECREVFDEAEKDVCFGAAARRILLERPGPWLALAPRKLAMTFDYAGAGGWYLHAASPSAFPERAKVALGAIETVFERVALLLALLVAARGPLDRVRARRSGRAGPAQPPSEDARAEERAPRAARDMLALGLALAGALAAISLHAWIGYVALGVLLLASVLRREGGEPAWPDAGGVLFAAAGAVVLSLACIHAVFFGAGRYSLVALPLVTAVAALALARRPRGGRPSGRGGE